MVCDVGSPCASDPECFLLKQICCRPLAEVSHSAHNRQYDKHLSCRCLAHCSRHLETLKPRLSPYNVSLYSCAAGISLHD